ncbi:required for meiotic nuclear division protein 1 homolog isoform X1 [Penaeus monodon]|uniref:required for meiotic nuclear division protein 1 homolog isoform X1 n=2 Tax=Penaeus monodon TaxID=6687 RepID=UPI0018A7B3DE|nr:required for meiotic nuclear division protein 1 homolog isoform X1 [Penaeus monodon]
MMHIPCEMACRTLTVGRQLLSDVIPVHQRLRHTWTNLQQNYYHGISMTVGRLLSSAYRNIGNNCFFVSQYHVSCHQGGKQVFSDSFAKRRPLVNSQLSQTLVNGAAMKYRGNSGMPLSQKPNVLSQIVSSNVTLLSGTSQATRNIILGRNDFSSIHNRISSLQAKKRVQRKKKQASTDSDEAQETVAGFAPLARHKFLTFDPDFSLPEVQVHRPPPREWQVTAYATADEYDLNELLDGLTHQGLYISAGINPGNTTNDKMSTAPGMHSDSHAHLSSKSGLHAPSHSVPDASDVLHMVATYRVETENREIYFFREGSVVFWNVPEIERDNVLRFLKKYETGRYDEEAVEEECESLTYAYSDLPTKTRLVKDKIMLNTEGQTDLEKYTFSNAMAMSVKLGIWESSLDKYIEKIEYVSEELSKTGCVVLTQDQVLQKMGQLFALRHLINLSSDLLDTPDFYWDHAELEQLYQKMANHLNISKRTSVMNVKLGHCVELMELLKSHLNEKHSARLEWIIIILIMVEVGFELLHYIERLL